MLDIREVSAGALLTIDLDAVRANYRLLRERLGGGAACAGVVKADAYGLGASRVAPALVAEGCRHFFVAHLDEAITLRPHIPADAELFVLHGVNPGVDSDCVAHGITPVLNSLEQIDAWTSLARSLNRTLAAVVQVDTGMSRLGLSPREMAMLAGDRSRLYGVDIRFVMSHLACAERQDHPMNAEQLERFEIARELFPGVPGCFANSSGIFLGREYHFDLVRPGAALYGVVPVVGAANPMRPVVRLQARVIQVREVEGGTRVGYGASWVAPGRCRIATVSAGYADGLIRSLGNRGAAWRGGTKLPIAGVVSMDTITLDVTDLGDRPLEPGALVDLIGEHNPVDVVAEAAGTIGYEILTSLGGRYHRHYIGG
ncbi:alanine racemase [Skermanella stibiiresistens SB22]|uniref:Alanine racemase n=1 Tax=Skermanella stibiiresistens SB22 TaxID=1385369 RepID=W9HDQ9_9PROT|nr:alanine racemase [Skermanella stibiiresistens]EWY42033.1 alanine racemase [Skermanella stibiiresistens SB22]